MLEAVFYKKLKNKVQCTACNRYCVIEEGKKGYCNSRKNINGKLFLLTYGKPTGLQIDPIEKKPLFHFKPGTSALSFGCFGCNFSCKHCQNWNISKEFLEKEINSLQFISPEEIVSEAIISDCSSIAYTYTEPTVFAEYCLNTMKLAKEKNIANIWVSNGYMSKELREKILPFIDAINIDLKGDKKFYDSICDKVNIEKVKENIKWFHEKGVHVEVTNLIIPKYNDSEKQLNELIEFIASVSTEIPLHFSAFYPVYKLTDASRTSEAILFHAKETAEKKGLKFVYVGNINSEENTLCKKCGNILIKRNNYFIEIIGLNKNKCSECNSENNLIL
ncbi:MAG: AmmeMemoRadiSam system radical SAM enzyme [Candidatus Diapherotrites archaeon]|nr:AmmeMemoRadiSam system radical SAM enzyme [Candidatus Diapherotrites archaeon]